MLPKSTVTLIPLALLSHATIAGADNLETLYDRRVAAVNRTTSASKTQIAGYLSTIRPDGTWATINYTAGCGAQLASWPAGAHWSRVLAMSAAYRGKTAGYRDNPDLLYAIRLAMEYWFANDYSTLGDGSCMDRDYLENGSCPCGTPGLWNENWFSNVIQVPSRVGPACVLLRDKLTESELGNCTMITSRAFAPYYREKYPGYLSGANGIDIAVIGIDAGLLENNRIGNISKIADAYEKVHNQVVIQSEPRVDGIKPDGSFQQQGGIIFDGNYGKDFTNSILDLELLAVDTRFRGNQTVRDTFGFHLDGSRWMTFTNTLSRVVHWDFSVIGRFISYPVADSTRASAGLQMQLEDVTKLGNTWGQKDLIEVGTALTEAANGSSVNAANLTGSRVFWSSDYMVHRTDQTVTTIKMLSNRTTTSKCSNSEGPYSFHISDGAVYTHTTGAEYEDIFAALDYNIIPGITTDYNETVLDCSTVEHDGIDTYAGGVEASDVGMAAMRYINPLSKSFGFYKAWFFFPDNVQHVLVSNIEQTKVNSTSPVYSVLDQRLRSGDVYINGSPISESGNHTKAKSLWHAGTGYAFPTNDSRALGVSVSLETRTGDWSKLGTSKVIATPKDIFAAWIPHKALILNPSPNATNAGAGKYTQVEYSVFPATSSYDEFEDKVSRLRPRTIVNTGITSAAIDSSAKILGAAFWKAEGGSITVKDMGIKLESNRGVVIMLKFNDEFRIKGTLSVADPSQGTGQVNIKITWTEPNKRGLGRQFAIVHRTDTYSTASSGGSDVTLDLPVGEMAGSTIVAEFSRTG
ncbi:chondroitinase AC precursor [Rhizoctonia solani]|uniref:Chondroitinase AC n=1 Tax=Rhizoctonia solani TaxID=456999 RepID=A0A0K6FSE4_9AGAM|nr:chondroitinase AC precursor [Rhizoctonia solani]